MKTENPYESPQTDLASTKDVPRPPMHKVAKALVAISITFSIISLVCGLIAWAFIMARWLSS